MEINKIYNESCLDTLARMPDNYLDCVITSPPYWQKRQYDIEFDAVWDGDKDCNHDFNPPTVTNNICVKCGAWKGQLGLEPDYRQYLKHLQQIMNEIKRCLKPEGTVWINLGDTYSTLSGKCTGTKKVVFDSTYLTNVMDGVPLIKGNQGMPDKCLMMIPHRFAIDSIDNGWTVRNDIIWGSTNKMPESVTDRFSVKKEYLFFMVKSRKYFFDLDKVREKHLYSNDSNDRQSRWSENYVGKNQGKRKPKNIEGQMDEKGLTKTTAGLNLKSTEEKQHPLGKNCGDVSQFWEDGTSDFWDIPTQPSSEEHYAAYNVALIRKPVLAGCPEGGIIYDPFMGTGSTAEAAFRANRKYIGSELSKKYARIAEKRMLPLLQQTTLFNFAPIPFMKL